MPTEPTKIIDFWWILPLISIVTALWIFTHNKVGNFNIVPEIRKDATLIVTGPYRFVRHPMYSSLILFMLGIILWRFSWLNVAFLAVMSVAVFIKAYREEKLWSRKDNEYIEYKERTKMIIPFIF